MVHSVPKDLIQNLAIHSSRIQTLSGFGSESHPLRLSALAKSKKSAYNKSLPDTLRFEYCWSEDKMSLIINT